MNRNRRISWEKIVQHKRERIIFFHILYIALNYYFHRSSILLNRHTKKSSKEMPRITSRRRIDAGYLGGNEENKTRGRFDVFLFRKVARGIRTGWIWRIYNKGKRIIVITGYEWQALQTISKCSLESIDLIRAMHHRSNRLISVIRCWRNFKRSKGEAIAGTLSIRSTHSNRNCARSIGTGKGNHRAKNRDTYRARSFWIFDPPSRRIEIPSEYGTSTTIVSDDEWNTDEDYLYSFM